MDRLVTPTAVGKRSAVKMPLAHPAPILILTGFAIGMAAHEMAQPAVAIAASAISFVSLSVLTGIRAFAHWKRVRRSRIAAAQAMSKLESRLHRHVAGMPRPHIRRRSIRRPGIERQYLPVVNSGRNNS